jgi:ABC-type transport system substrate-binding protein
MRKYSSIVALLMAVAMLLTFVGCNDDKGKTTTTTLQGTEVDPETGLEIVTFEGDYTWKDAVVTLATNWNPHTYETSDDSYPLDFITAGLYTFIYNDALHPVEGKDPYAGYKIIPEMAAELPVDVTEDIAKNKPQYGVPADATKGYAYKIKLNDKATWDDGTPIKAVDYVESMRRLFDPRYLNYRAVDYMGSNDLAIANAEKYYNALTKELFESVKWADAEKVLADGGKIYIDVYAFWGAGPTYVDKDGNPTPQYVSIDDETVYGESVGDAFSGKMLFDTYGAAYLKTGAYPVYKAVVNENYTENWAENFDKEVGIFASGEYEITIVLEKSLSGFYLLYNLSGNWLVKTDLYDSCLKQEGNTYLSTYNTSVETCPSYGPYKMVEYQADKSMKFVKNEKWYGHSDIAHVYQDPEDGLNYRMYQTTAVDCQVVAEAETRKLMFLKGELMGYGLQAADYDSYRGSDYCFASPATATFFLILNGHKSAIASREAAEDFDTSKYDLECMTLTTFKQAMALSYDRDHFASEISPARKGAFGLFGTAYIYDPDTGATYRDTDQAKKALCEFYAVDVSKYPSLDDAVASITGYDVEGARKFFKQAYDEAIAAGFITDTDKDGKSDQTVQMEYAMSSDSDFMTQTINYLNEKVNEVTKGTPFEGKIEFIKSAIYGNAWSDKLKQGLADTCLAGWSGSALNPYSLTDLYVNPSRSYTDAWFDPTTVDMELTIDGNKIKMNLKQWSDALNGTEVEVGGKKYNFGDGQTSVENRLSILAGFETAVLKSINYLPMLEDGSMALLSQQVYYVVEAYNPVMGRGGMAYAKYNFNDTEWAEYVKAAGGELKY